MKTRIIIALTALTLTSSLGLLLSGSTHDADLVEIEKVVGYYLDAGRVGDPDLLRQAFHDSARLQFVKDDEYGQWTAAEYIGWRKPGKTSQYESRILSVDCAGDAAVVKAEMVFETVAFVDYLSLLRIDGRWWIVNKVFHREAR